MFEQLSHIFQSFFDFAGTMLPFGIHLRFINIFEILVLVFIVFKIYRYIVGSHAELLLKGILMLLMALVLSKLFSLEIIGKVLESVVNIVIFSLVVIFQPELRRLLGYLGQKGFLSKHVIGQTEEGEVREIVEKIVNAIKHLSKTHTGALIVFCNSREIENVIEVGTKLNASISTELIITIFHPNTPLHDGAMVIQQNKIVASGVLLPLTEDPKLSWQYGTRHRAAIGMSEISDATCLVVSEETGNISLTREGKLTPVLNLDDLRTELESLYGVSDYKKGNTNKEDVKEKNKFSFQNFFSLETPQDRKDIEK